MCQKYANTVLLFKITPVIEEKFNQEFGKDKRGQSNDNIELYNAVLCRLANEYGIALADNTYLINQNDVSAIFENDGLHLSPLGHKLFAKKWLAAVCAEINK